MERPASTSDAELANPIELADGAGATRANRLLARLWLDALAAERGAAPGTLDTYGDDLACYLGWLADPNGGAGLALAAVRRENIARYLAHLDRARGYAEATIGHRRSVVRTLHRFLVAEGLATHDPLLEVAPLKRPRRLPYTPTVAEVDRLLETAHAQAADASVGLYRQAGHARRAASSRCSTRPACG